MNPVYRAVERQAHGLVPLTVLDGAIIGLAAAGGIAVHFFAAFGAALVAFGVVVLLRRRCDGRREWARLWMRRFEAGEYRLLEPDLRYRQYGGRRR